MKQHLFLWVAAFLLTGVGSCHEKLNFKVVGQVMKKGPLPGCKIKEKFIINEAFFKPDTGSFNEAIPVSNIRNFDMNETRGLTQNRILKVCLGFVSDQNDVKKQNQFLESSCQNINELDENGEFTLQFSVNIEAFKSKHPDVSKLTQVRAKIAFNGQDEKLDPEDPELNTYSAEQVFNFDLTVKNPTENNVNQDALSAEPVIEVNIGKNYFYDSEFRPLNEELKAEPMLDAESNSPSILY